MNQLKRDNVCRNCKYLLEEIDTDDNMNPDQRKKYFCTANPELVEQYKDIVDVRTCRFYEYYGSQIKLTEVHKHKQV